MPTSKSSERRRAEEDQGNGGAVLRHRHHRRRLQATAAVRILQTAGRRAVVVGHPDPRTVQVPGALAVLEVATEGVHEIVLAVRQARTVGERDDHLRRLPTQVVMILAVARGIVEKAETGESDNDRGRTLLRKRKIANRWRTRMILSQLLLPNQMMRRKAAHLPIVIKVNSERQKNRELVDAVPPIRVLGHRHVRGRCLTTAVVKIGKIVRQRNTAEKGPGVVHHGVTLVHPLDQGVDHILVDRRMSSSMFESQKSVTNL